jgi:dihydropteroate synthase
LSIDTSKADVADRTLAAGAHIINDITALGDPGMADVIRRHRAGVVLMHMRGTPQTMQIDPTYHDVVKDVAAFLQARLQRAEDLGIARTQVVLDPGIGFGKTQEHNLQLIAHLAELGKLGRPVCLGVSRKGFLGLITGRSRQERQAGSLAVACHAMAQRAAQVIRVHDVAGTKDAVRIFDAIEANGAA